MLLEVKSEIRSLIVSSISKMTIQELQKDYKAFVGHPLPYVQLGFNSAEELLRSIPDVVRINGYGPQSLVHYVPNEKSAHIANLVKNQKTTNKPRKRVVRQRRQRLHPIHMSMSDESPEEVANVETDSPSSSINKAEEGSNKLATQRSGGNQTSQPSAVKVFHYDDSTASRSQLYTDTQEVIVRSKYFNITSPKEDNENNALHPCKEHKLESNLNYLLINQHSSNHNKSKRSNIQIGPCCFAVKEICNTDNDAVPKYAVTDLIRNLNLCEREIHKEPVVSESLEIPPCKLYEELEEGSIISLFISEIHNPLVFFFHIDKEDHELIKLENEMTEFYSMLESNSLILSGSYLEPGKFCAASIGDIWYRAKILFAPNYLNDFSKIKLCFVDYGSVYDISVKRIKLLAPKFFSVPIQAARGRLFQIKANENARSAASTNYFASLVNERCIYGYVANVEKDSSLLDLILVDTNVQPKCNINEILMKKGFIEKEEA